MSEGNKRNETSNEIEIGPSPLRNPCSESVLRSARALASSFPRNLLAAHSGRYVALRQSGVGPGRPISEGRAFPSFFSVCSSVLLVFSSIFWFCPSVFLNLFFFKHEFFYFSSLIFKIWSFFEFEQFLSLNMFLFWTILNLNFFWVWTIFQVWYFLKFVKKLPNIFNLELLHVWTFFKFEYFRNLKFENYYCLVNF
jgi:hypothetical protein